MRWGGRCHCEEPSLRAQRSNLGVIARPAGSKQSSDVAIWIASYLAMTVLAQRHCERIVIASEAKQSQPSLRDPQGRSNLLNQGSNAAACVAGRPKPTLCKHGGEAEPAAQGGRLLRYARLLQGFALRNDEDCFVSLLRRFAPRNDGSSQ